MTASELHAREDEGGPAVGGGTDLEQPQRVGHHGRGQHLVDGDLLAIARVGVGQPVARVLDLDLCEVLLGRAEAVHTAARVEREVGRVGRTHQMEAQPVRVVLALAPHRGEEALRCRVGSDHQRDVAQPGQDLRPRVGDGHGARCAGGVDARHPRPGPAERLGERRARHEPRIPVADGVGARDELHVAPAEPCVGQRVACRGEPVLDEGAPPLAPLVHAGAEHRHLLVVGHRQASPPGGPAPSGRHFHTR